MIAPSKRRLHVAPESRPVLARHARLKHDEARGRWVLLVPERILAPDPIAIEILQLCDGERDVNAIVDALAIKFVADREVIAADVVELLQDLADKGFVIAAREKIQ